MNKNVEGVHTGNSNKLNKKPILVIIIILLVIISCISILEINKIQKTEESLLAEEEQKKEQELINLNVEIKSETDTEYTCLLTFSSSDENNKIKSIEYPSEEGKEPQIIQVADNEGREKIAIDYKLDKSNIDKTFKIETIKGNIIKEKTSYVIAYNNNIGTVIKEEHILKGSKTFIDMPNLSPSQGGKHFVGWAEDKTSLEPDYFENGKYTKLNKDTTFYAIWTEEKNGYREDINNESLIGKISQINANGVQTITVNGVTYTANVIVENRDLVLDGEQEVTGATLIDKVYEFGNKEVDVAKADEQGNVQDAQNMVILKVNGNLTINPNVKLTACKSDNGYGGPKGLFIYVTGTFSNSGTIDMTARGARAEGQDVYLWQNADGNYEYVPAEGAQGGTGITLNRKSMRAGNSGIDAVDRQTGGGGSGSCEVWETDGSPGTAVTTGNGGLGSSYSGGTGGGGAAKRAWYEARVYTESGANSGGKGGDSASVGSHNYTATRRYRKSWRKRNKGR